MDSNFGSPPPEKMTRDEIHAAIVKALTSKGMAANEIRIQPDRFGGWRIVVVSSGFDGIIDGERRQVLLNGLGNLQIEWLELLTPEEQAWAGKLPLDSDLDQLPLWPEALARSSGEAFSEIVPVFPSQLDEDLQLPITATFYSLRGGVGRSTALAYTAAILAANGRKVVCVDMDLEAPGLPALFGRDNEVTEGFGLVPLLIELDQGGEPDITKHLLRISDSDDLYCLPAGKPDAAYARLLGFIDPASWYREEHNPLRELLARLKDKLSFRPDVILIDSRTGISPISGPLLFDLADISIIAFFPHPQARVGTGALVRALLSAKTQRQHPKGLTPEPRFIITPIPSARVPEVVRRYQHRALEWISEWMAVPKTMDGDNSASDEADITHFIPYKESIATSDQISRDPELWRDYLPIADWIELFLPSVSEKTAVASLGFQKEQILAELTFSGGTAEDQDDFQSTFVETALVKKALGPSPLVLGRKGTGKTAIFRRIAEDHNRRVVIVTSPRIQDETHLSPDGFRSIDSYLTERNVQWSQFWPAYIGLVVFASQKIEAPPLPTCSFIPVIPTSEVEMVRLLKALMAEPDSGLITRDWLRKLDRAYHSEILLLFDGLDTGFGSSDADRKRRKVALEGLFSFYLGVSDSYRYFRFKVLLREDIWRQLRFENKSHFFGKTETLKWNDQVGLFKVGIKQAVRARTLHKLIEDSNNREGVSEIDSWADSHVFSAWNILVGERMKGGKTAFTRNWVWNRLADANGDHSPRYLIQLLHQVTQWERTENRRSPYDRSIIRPRGLIAVLPDVSEQALGALRDEEFQELIPLMEKLSDLGRTPLVIEDLAAVDKDLIELAREVGLLGVYEGSEEQVDRFKVPELFRYALRMTRKGQA
jgi:cellulose biosynthesis protein BcsQ